MQNFASCNQLRCSRSARRVRPRVGGDATTAAELRSTPVERIGDGESPGEPSDLRLETLLAHERDEATRDRAHDRGALGTPYDELEPLIAPSAKGYDQAASRLELLVE